MKAIAVLLTGLMMSTGVVLAQESDAPAPTLGPPIAEQAPAEEEPKEEKVLDVLYVTDKLVLGMKDNPRGTGKNIKLLRSGMRLEVLAKEGAFNKVRTDKGEVGWAKSNFMVKDKPAVLLVTELKEENQALRKEIDNLKQNDSGSTLKDESRNAVTDKPVEDETLKQRLMELEASLSEARTQLAEKESMLEDAQAGIPAGPSSGISFIFLLVALAVGLMTGGILMYFYFEKRISQRFAGLKV